MCVRDGCPVCGKTILFGIWNHIERCVQAAAERRVQQEASKSMLYDKWGLGK
jgi:hypothetical protein